MKKLIIALLTVILLTGCNAVGETPELTLTPEPSSEPTASVSTPEPVSHVAPVSFAPLYFDSEEDLFAAIAQDPTNPFFEGLTEIYRPAIIPQGYWFAGIEISSNQVVCDYVNDAGQIMMFVWERNIPATIEARNEWINRGEIGHEFIEIGDIEYLVITYPSGVIMIAWIEDGKSFWISPSDPNFTVEDALAFAKFEAVEVPTAQ